MSIDIKNIVKNLHPLEVRIILTYKKGDELTIEKVEKELGFKPGNGNQALSWLTGKNLIKEIRRETTTYYELTVLGDEWKEKGSPEERILELIRRRLEQAKSGPQLPDIAQALGMENKDIGSAFGSLSKLGILKMDDKKNVVLTIPLEHFADPAKNPVFSRFRLIRGLLEKLVQSGGL
ncbi:MAG: phenylalanine--tRNA ligase subunit alpha, partial [Treponema sp.]|nr:phenylalanine--tRNA ligase subunit alpha [Treponema sp.]